MTSRVAARSRVAQPVGAATVDLLAGPEMHRRFLPCGVQRHEIVRVVRLCVGQSLASGAFAIVASAWNTTA